MKYDLENFATDIRDLLLLRLNEKIQLINVEKGDFEIKEVSENAYCFQSLDERAMNYSPFLIYGFDDIISVSNGPLNADSVLFSATIIIADDGAKNIMSKLLRYQRALREVFQKHWDEIGHAQKGEIKSLNPLAFQFANSSHPSRAIGIQIMSTLG